jgi:hypothetical protein
MAEKEYIERNALIAEYDRVHVGPAGGARKLMVDAPAADVVEVVRCKDCKNAYINSFSAISGVALCRFWTNRAEGNQVVMQQDDFCSYGERRGQPCEEE